MTFRFLASVVATSIAINALLTPASASFGGFCSEPQPPWCLNGSLKDEYAFQSCRSEVQGYVKSAEHYADCLRDEANRAIRKANDVVRQFNCKAKGQTFCY